MRMQKIIRNFLIGILGFVIYEAIGTIYEYGWKGIADGVIAGFFGLLFFFLINILSLSLVIFKKGKNSKTTFGISILIFISYWLGAHAPVLRIVFSVISFMFIVFFWDMEKPKV